MVNEVEEVAPVPCKVLDNTMSIQFHPKIKGEQTNARGPTKYCHNYRFRGWGLGARHGEKHISNEVAHEDKVDQAAKEQPGVVLERSSVEVVVFRNLRLKFSLEESAEFWMRIFVRPRRWEQL